MSDSIKPSKPKEAIGRFLAKFTGGKYANNEMLQVRGGKVETAVADVRAEIVRLQGRGVSSPALNEMLQNLQDARENAFWVKGSGKRYDAMEKVKQGARTAAKTAKEQVDNSLALLSTLPQTSIAAWNAIKEAERVIQGAPNPQQHAQALADLETRRAALSAVTESTELAPAIAGLVQVKTDAWQLAADVATANALAALDEVEAEIGRLQDAGVRSASLDRTYADLRASHALALSGQNEAKRYDDLETVKQMARAATVTAKKQVDNILARLNTHAQTSIAASTAIQQADAAIQETLDPTKKRLDAQKLADLQARHTAHGTVTESSEINPATAELARVEAEARQLAADVTAANALALNKLGQDRTDKLLDIDKELGKLRKLNQKVVDPPLLQFVQDKLTDLTTRRNALAQAPLGQLQAELAKVPALLQDISNAAKESEHCGKWGEVRPSRDMIRGACNLYVTAANKHNKDKLKQDSLALQQKLTEVEAKAFGPPPDPLNAYNRFNGEIEKLDYGNLKKEYYKQILRGPLTAKAEALEQKDPNSAEAQMKLALGSGVYETRMLEAWNTAKAFGSPLTKKLTPGEAVAIYTYTSNDYKKINGKILGYRPPLSPTEDGQITIMTEQAKKALAKLDDYVGITKRGDGYPIDDNHPQFALNNVFTINAFWSTGAGYSFPGKWQITIHGKTGKEVKPISNYPKEAEVLFPPGSTFKVIDRDDTEAPNTIYVTVEQV